MGPAVIAPKETEGKHRKQLTRKVKEKEERKLRRKRIGDDSIWRGFGMFGVVGWSVAVPTLIGVAVGLWIDAKWPSRISWTLTMTLIGLVVGCLNAWFWISRERSQIGEHRDGNGID
jgi:ATP synthase protein I